MRFSSKTFSLLTRLIHVVYTEHIEIDLLIQEFDLLDEIQGHSENKRPLVLFNY